MALTAKSQENLANYTCKKIWPLQCVRIGRIFEGGKTIKRPNIYEEAINSFYSALTPPAGVKPTYMHCYELLRLSVIRIC